MANDRFALCRELMTDILEEGRKHLKIKQLYRQMLKEAQKEDPLRCSLLAGDTRRRFGENWDDGVTEYRIIKGQWSEEEIREAVDDAWIHIYSPYDCTGQLFTVDIHAKQTPAGLVWIHRMGIDV